MMRRESEKRDESSVERSESSVPADRAALNSRRAFASLIASVRSRRADACALGFVVVFFAIFFGWLLLPEGLYPVSGDSYFYGYPLRVDAWRMIRAGQLPLWTPHILSGYPLLSMGQLAIGYPLTWGYAFLPAHVAETLYVLAPFLLAPAFTYIYARQTGRSRAASLFAGLAFGWGGGVANALAHSGMMTNAVIWLPLVLTAVERARTRPFVNCLVGATAAYTLCVLSGHAQGFAYAGALALCYAAFLSIADSAQTQRIFDRLRPLAVCVGALLASAGLSAFQLMETARVARRSVRAMISYETFAEGTLPPVQLFESFALPLYSQSDISSYVAPLALAFALAGAWLCLRRDTRQRDARPVFWTCAALVALLLMLGDGTPLYRLVYHVPVINRFRVPTRHSFELTFALAALSAYGFDLIAPHLAARRGAQAHARSGRLRLAVAVASVALCALVGFAWQASARAGSPTTTSWTPLTETQFAAWKIGFSLLTLVMAGLCLSVARTTRSRAALVACAFGVALFFEPFICYSLWWRDARKDAARFAAPAAATRFMLAHAPEENRVYTRVPLFSDQIVIPSRVDAPNLSAARGLRDVAGYEPLTLARYARALADGEQPDPTRARQPPPRSLFGARSRVLDLLNATYVAVLTNEGDPLSKTLPRIATRTQPGVGQTSGTQTANAQTISPQATDAQTTDAQTTGAPATDRWEPVDDDDGLLIVRNLRACPRAWLVSEAVSVDGEEALHRIRGEGPDFDPRRTALVEDAPNELPPLPGGELDARSSVRVVAYEPSRIVVETDAQTPTLLVLSEMFYPGWEATVDGHAERIHLADFLLRAVPLPAGTHRMEMRYRAPQARNGAIISLVMLLSLAGLVVVARRRRRPLVK
jgi:hypothetical protein